MATTVVTDTKFIDVGADPVLLKVQVGYTQAGGSYVVLIKNDGSKEEVLPQRPGEYELVIPRQSILSCTTTVQDISMSTNQTSVRHIFSAGNPQEFSYSKEVEHQNDKVVYDIQYINL